MAALPQNCTDMGLIYRPRALSSSRSKRLTWGPCRLKTALLLALASVKRVGNLQALYVNASCLEFGPNDCKVVLQPRSGYVPKVLSNPFRAQVISLLALPVMDGEQGPNFLCPVRAHRVYVERSRLFRQS